MIEITLLFFLIIYLILVFIALIYVFLNLYHLVRFGILDFYSVFFSFIFLAVLSVILFISYQEVIKIDWQLIIFSLEIPEIELPSFNLFF